MTEINGFRVEPADMEQNIREIAGIEQAIVKAFHKGDRNILCAYYISKTICEEELRMLLRDKLPEYMIPTFFVRVDSFKKNRNGKIDRSILTLPTKKDDYIEPITESERLVCDALSKVFGTKVGLEGDFVSLGGDSVRAMIVQHELEGKISVSQVLSLRRPSVIAEAITGSDDSKSCGTTEWDGSPVPLTEGQLNVYLDEKTGKRGTSYNIPFNVTYPPSVTKDRLLDAIRSVIDAHPVLKGRVIDDDIPMMAFDAMPSVDVSTSLTIRPFDIMSGPLCRFVVSDDRLANGRVTVLHADIHQLAFDGGSFVPFITDIDRALAGEPLISDRHLPAERMDPSKPEMLEFFEKEFCDRDVDSGIIPDVDGVAGVEHSMLTEAKERVTWFCRSMSITIGSFFASAFAYTLSRFTGRSDAVFLTAESGRDFTLSKSIGMYVRTVPVCIECNDTNIRKFLSEASASFLGSMSSSSVQFRELVSRYGNFGRVMFHYDHGLFSPSDVAIQHCAMERLGHEPTLDFSLAVTDENGKYSLRLEHSDIVSAPTARRFISSFDSIVSGLMSSLRLSDLQYTSAEDIAIQDKINETEHELRFNDIIQAFKEKVAQQPDHILVTYLDRKYTYAEADRITDGIAYELSKKGVGKGDHVAILVPRSEWYLLAAIAVLKTGAAYVPIDDSYPDERIGFMLTDSSAKAMITSRSMRQHNGTVFKESYLFVEDWMRSRKKFRNVHSGPDGTFAILYTSGTTGMPKGTVIRHINILSHLSTYVRNYHVTCDDVYSSYVSYGFDAVITGLFVPLVTGSSVDIVPDDVRFDMRLLSEHYKKSKPTITELPASVCRLYLQSTKVLPFRLMTTGGEAIGRIGVPEGLDLQDTYGPTELFDYITFIGVSEKSDPSSIGTPCDNSKVYVLDKEKRRVPFGAVGELYVSGLQVTGGYLNREKATSEAFFDNPFVSDLFARKGYGRMYRTGDFARYLPDGTIGFLGRRDGQVKIRGNRVELTEVEAVIRTMVGVKSVTVQPIVNATGGKELCAYVVAEASVSTGDVSATKATSTLTSASIQSHVFERKPAYMVPSHVVFLDKIPLNVNGKVDRRALPKPDISATRTEYISPRNDVEKSLCDAFAEALGMDKIGIDDDFIQLGGDSLKAIMVQNISKASTTADILRYRSPRMISEHCATNDYRTDLYTLETGCPLSESQLNVYLDIIANEKRGKYIIPFEYELPKGCPMDKAIAALRRAIGAHPILAFHIDERNGEPWIVPKGDCISTMDAEASIDTIGIADCITDKPVEISDIDLHRRLSSFTVSHGWITGLISHIAFDGFSTSSLAATFDKIFAGDNVETDKGFLTISSFDSSIRSSERYSMSKEYFDRMFCDSETDSGLIDDIDGRAGSFTSVFSASYGDVEKFVRTCRTSVGAFFTSAFAYTLSRFTGRSDAVFTIAENGRDLPGLEDSVGMFVRTIPIRIDCSDRDVKEFTRSSAETIYVAMSSAIYPFRLVHNEFGVRSDIIFQYMAGFDVKKSSDDTNVESITFDGTSYDALSDIASICDLSVAVKDIDGKIFVLMTHSARYSEATVKRIADAYGMIVTGLLSETKLSEIQFTSAEDIALQDKINETEHKLRYNDIIEAFEEKVSQQPNHVLVTYLDRSYTYAEADRITDGIAYALSKKGIGKGDNVAILVPRSEWYLLAALAVLKTGAAYVPLDDSYPDERIAFMISDCSAKCVIVTSESKSHPSMDSFVGTIVDVKKCKFQEFESKIPEKEANSVLLYTSGTTGVPKASQISRLALLNLSEWYCDETGFSSKDVIALHTAYTFDMHTMAMFPPLIVGATLDVIPDECRLDMELLDGHFVEKGVTHTFMTTQVGKVYASRRERHIRVLFVAGEKLGEYPKVEGLRMYDGYGPSENLALSTSILTNDRCDSSSVGVPNNNVKAYVLDKEGRRLPIGSVGELYLSGYQLSKGYLNRDELNAASFRDNPFASERERSDGYARMYATGDYFRYLLDGTLGIIGRRDGQVKIRGNRVELTEVESAIRFMDGVKDVTVQAIVNDTGGKELCAYVVTDAITETNDLSDSQATSSLTSASIQSYVSERKPAYMVPSYVVFLRSIPLNVNGKVDRHALPKPDRSSSRQEYVAPRNDNEVKLCEAFAEVLGIDNIGINDDFILLGGDSLMAIRVQNISRVSTTADILRYRSPRMICEHCVQMDYRTDLYALETGCPLSESQLNVYLDIIANEKKGAYVIPFEYVLPMGCSRKKAVAAIQKVIEAHPILRSRVEERNGEPWIVCNDAFDRGTDSCISAVQAKISDIDMKGCLSSFSLIGNRIIGQISHLIFDGFSVSNLARTFDKIFSGEKAEIDKGFLLSSSFDTSIRNSKRYSKSKEYFDRMFCDADAESGLLDDIDGRMGFHTSTLSCSSKSMDGFVSSLKVSAGAFFSSAFAYTLSRFTGRSDAVFTIAENGRELPGLEDAVGMFVRTIPIRIDCSDREVKEFVRSSADTVYGAMSSAIYPFRLVHNEYGVRSDIIFQYMAGIEAQTSTTMADESNISDHHSDDEPSDVASICDLSVNVKELGGRIVISITHSSRYSDATAERIAFAYDKIISGLLSEEKLSDIMFTSAHDIEIQDRLNENERPFIYDDIIQAFKEKVEQLPDNILVTYLDRKYTYAEADRITDGIAHVLSEKGIGKGDNVAILVPRSEWYPLSALSVLRQGGAYVPIVEDYPDERISFILSDSLAKAVITSVEFSERIRTLTDIPAIVVEKIDFTINHESTIHEYAPELPAVVLYTSGTTGKPKGTIISRHALNALGEWYAYRYKLGNSDIYGWFASFVFDAHLRSIAPVIVAGACIDVVPEDVRYDMVALNDHYCKHSVTQTFLPTQVGKLFASVVDRTTLKVINMGGEKLGSVESIEGCMIADSYGPTENTVITAATDVTKKCDVSSVGPINENCKAYILDRERRRVPFGAVGELFVSGHQLSSGYLNRDDMNAEHFFSNPFIVEIGYERMYATGDYFRYLPDGTLGVIGRRDGQVKIRGNRVELTEVEAVIRSMRGINDVTVQAIVNESGGKELCAYVVADATSDVYDGQATPSPTSTSIQSYVSERKPAYMVPSYIVFIEKIPLNVNGKVDMRALPKPDTTSSRTEHVAPRNFNERKLCEAFAEVLGVDNIGIDDDFIQLGGDSLKAIRVQNISRVSTTADILRYRSPRSICEHCVSIDYETDLYTLETGCPLSESQLNVYLDIIANEKKDTYVIPFEYDIPNRCSKKRAVSAILKAVEAHPILRSHVEERNGEPWIVCHGTVVDTAECICISDVPARISDIDVRKCLSSFTVSDGKIVGMISHIAFDGFSASVLVGTFDKVFSGEEVETDIGFLISSSFDSSIRGGERYSSCKGYFDRMFCDADTDSGLIDDVDGKAGSHSSVLSDSAEAIGRFISSNRVSAGAFFASAFAYTLSRFTGRSDAVFTVAENGRDLSGLEDSVGMFVRTIPMRMDCSDRTVAEFLRDSADTVYGAMSSAIYPFRLVHNAYGVKSDIIFQYRAGIEAQTSSDGTVSSGAEDVDMLFNAESICDLSVAVKEIDGKVFLSIIHSSRYSDATVERMAEAFDSIVTGFLTKSKLSDIQFTSARDIEIQDGTNETEHPLRYDDIIQAFWEKVALQPEHILVTYLHRKYTYGEADRITDGIAYALSKKDIGKGDNVAILVPRSEWYLLAALAVLKTGATYVPIDDSYPDERISFMISDSSAKAILVTYDTMNRTSLLTSGDATILDISSVGHHAFEHIIPGKEDDSVLLYTSGTTGMPKATRITHLALISFSEWYADRFGFTSDDIYGMSSSFVFDAHIMALYPAIVAGGSVDVIPEDMRLDMGVMNDRFIEIGVTHTFLTTQVGKIFASSVTSTSLKVLTVGGEKLGDVTVPEGYALYDGYGPTENTVFTSVVDVKERISTSSVGRLNCNVRGYILDGEGRRLPIGAVGELHLSGYQLSSGYRNRDDLNRSVFSDNPFVAESERSNGHGRMYATGDYFRYLPDGTLGIIGRRDGQVKIRGNRVELTEVDAVIRSMSGVKDVTVQAILNDNGGKELCAYVVVDATSATGGQAISSPSSASVQSYVSERKPAYMVPSHVVFLERIPLNVNGKVDRRALPKPNTSSSCKEYVAPRNDGERKLCEAFAEVLGMEKVGIDDDFIQLGGDSLKAIRVQNTSKVSTTADILRYRSPRAISAHLFEYALEPRYDLDTGCPLNNSQMHMYDKILALESRYHCSMSAVCNFELTFEGNPSDRKLKTVLDKVIDTHPVLKGRLSEKDGEPWLTFDSRPKITFADFPESFHLDKDVCSFSISDGRIRGFINHLVFDGYSLKVLADSLRKAYAGDELYVDKGFLLPVTADESFRESHLMHEAEDYFDSIFRDCPHVRYFPDDGIVSETYSFSRSLNIDKAKLDTKLRQWKISPGAFFTSVFAFTVSSVSGCNDVIFRTVENGRNFPGAEDSVGMFIRFPVLRIDCDNPTVEGFLREGSDRFLRTIRYDPYDFRELEKKHLPVIECEFQYDAGVDTGLSINLQLTEDMYAIGKELMGFDVVLKEVPDGLQIIIWHSPEYSDETVSGFADSFESICNMMLDTQSTVEIRRALKSKRHR